MKSKLYITNISSRATEAELESIFMQVGTVISVRIATDPRTNERRNYGFVEMETQELARTALRSISGYLLHDRKLQLSELHTPDERESNPAKQTQPRAVRPK